MQTDELRIRIREIIAQELELEPEEFTDTGHFVDDYDADSLSLITVVARIEKELGVLVPKAALPEMTTLDSALAVVLAHSAESERV
ncbi:acyl carrier protein [Kutzneria buriramensis]|uniref:Acyl carrier protein n=1 Tax=Kutzneria buriramensis TaxID=1045776 RepID=A0A3E0HL09_9PSEU|nr:acyl carrier protein [Kutzneria buriramensis]REH47030.1 acyl carrier protein [Kutzneria buriramensis]